jgi:hypothetical protein
LIRLTEVRRVEETECVTVDVGVCVLLRSVLSKLGVVMGSESAVELDAGVVEVSVALVLAPGAVNLS